MANGAGMVLFKPLNPIPARYLVVARKSWIDVLESRKLDEGVVATAVVGEVFSFHHLSDNCTVPIAVSDGEAVIHAATVAGSENKIALFLGDNPSR